MYEKSRKAKHGSENSSKTVKQRDMAKNYKIGAKGKFKKQNVAKPKTKLKKESKVTTVKNTTKNVPTNIVPTHYSQLDPKTMTVAYLQHELRLRGRSNKGKKELLVVRLELALKTEKSVEEKKSVNRRSTRSSSKK